MPNFGLLLCLKTICEGRSHKISSPNIPPKCQGKKITRAFRSSWNGADWAKQKRALRRCDGTAASGELDESHEPPRPGIVHEESLAESRASATNAGWPDPVNGERESGMVMVIFVWKRSEFVLSVGVATAFYYKQEGRPFCNKDTDSRRGQIHKWELVGVKHKRMKPKS